MGFQDLLKRCYRATRKNTAFFAQTVTYRSLEGGEFQIDTPVSHSVRQVEAPDGSTTVFEQIVVEIDRDDLEKAPDYGDRILLTGDERAYLYSYRGKHTTVAYKATFERRTETARGTIGTSTRR